MGARLRDTRAVRTTPLDRDGVAPDRPRAGQASTHTRAGALVVAALVGGYLLQVGLRLALAAGRYGPLVLADETGYLMNARYLAGGVPAGMSGSMFYRGGYALFVAPAYLLGDDPHRIYLLVLGINALMSAAVFPLTYYLLTRAFRIATGPALAGGFLAALYPPLVLNALLAQAETALYLLVLLAIIALARFVAVVRRGPMWTWALGGGVVTGLLYTTHGRTAPVVGVLAAAFALVGVVRRDRRVAALAALAAAGATLVAGQALNSMLVHRLWGGSTAGDVHLVLDRLSRPGVAGNLGALALGQYWYLAVGSFGLIVLGVCSAVAALRVPASPPLPAGAVAAAGAAGTAAGTGTGTGAEGVDGAVVPESDPRRSGGGRIRAGLRARLAPSSRGAPLAAAVALASLLGLIVLTGIFLFPVSRPDMVVYGRYAEVLAPVFLALGLCRLWTARPVWRVLTELTAGAALVVGALAVLVRFRDGIIHGRISNSYTTLSLPAMSDSIARLHPLRVTVIALVGAALLAVFSRRLRVVGAMALAAALVWSSVDTRSTLFEHTATSVYGHHRGNDVTVPGLDRPQNVGYDVGFLTLEGRWVYPWKLNDTRFVLFNSVAGEKAPNVRYVISGKQWSQAAELGARQVWSEATGEQAVWLIPSHPATPPR